MEIQLSNEEKLELENCQLKIRQLQFQQQSLNQEFELKLIKICNKNKENASQLATIDLNSGILIFKNISNKKDK